MREQVVRDIKGEFLDTTFDYLVKHGLENTSIRDLCKDIGISSGSLYYWFAGKDDLYINAAKHGLARVAQKLFAHASSGLSNPERFFSSFINEVSKYKQELRLIYQVATSPVYGEMMRESADNLNGDYEDYIVMIADSIKCKPEDLAPIIFICLSIILDYVVWDDYKVTKMQLDYVCKLITGLVNTI